MSEKNKNPNNKISLAGKNLQSALAEFESIVIDSKLIADKKQKDERKQTLIKIKELIDKFS